ncbi:MAG: TetR/AcrR family transcriptional regulator [Desulfobacteraceae bacterium]|nr:TetR/AcrR family transcriptional regulator [Desulfobacteraceae bacterium]
MQMMDEQKRLNILAAAAKLFADRPFHKVLLSDVAEAAGVGKGTLYIYFKSKEDLYLSVVYDGFARLVDRLRSQIDEDAREPVESLELAVREFIYFIYQNPHLYELMHTLPGWKAVDRPKWDAKRMELRALLESIISQGVLQGCFADSNPRLTARYIPGLVRAALFEDIKSVDRQMLTDHILHFVKSALAVKEGLD